MPEDVESKAVSDASSTQSTNCVEKADAAKETLPLRPSIRERITYVYHRALPRPYYLHPQLTRLRLILIAIFILLLAIILPTAILCSHRSGAGRTVKLPTGREIYKGEGTYYGTGMGACGIVANDSQMIVAISKDVYDAFGKGTAAAGNPNLNVVCGRKIRARRAGTSGGVEVTVVDRCVGCAPTDLDFSPKAFLAVGATAEGRVPIEWAWV